MKTGIFILYLVFAIQAAYSQTWEWALRFGGAESESSGSNCVDAFNDLYLTGSFRHNCIVGSDTLLSESMTTPLIAKISETGSVVWAMKAEGYELMNGYSPSLRLFYEGYDSSLIAFTRMSGSNQAIGDCMLFAGGQMGQLRSYLTKLDIDGTCSWTIPLVDFDMRKLSSDDAGCLYGLLVSPPLGGTFQGTFLEAGFHLVKLNTLDGSVKWAKKILVDPVLALDLSYEGGSLWIGGYTGGGSSFNIDSQVFTTNPDEVFISNFDTSGVLLWVNTLGEPPIEYGNFLGVDDDGNSYVAGLCDIETQFGDTSLSSINGNDLFIIKYDETGERTWLRTSSSNGLLKYKNLFTDAFGNTVITGKFSNTVTFGDYTLVAANAEDGFVVKYDNLGNCIGAKAIWNVAGSLVPIIDNEGSLLVSGAFNDESDFDGIILTSAGLSDVFVAKIDLKTGVPEARLDGSSELFIYANPNEGKCTIDVPDDFLYENNLILRIFDSSGKLIRQTPLVMNQGRIQLSLEQEAKGIYTATLSNSEKSYHGRIVFE